MEEHSITKTTKFFMVSVAVIFDLIQFGISFIPILGEIVAMFINLFGQMTFWLWFKMHGIEYNSTKRLAAFATGAVIGFIPILDMLPELTFEVILILSTITIEEEVSKHVPGGERIVGVVNQLSTQHPETKNLKQNFKELKADRIRTSTLKEIGTEYKKAA